MFPEKEKADVTDIAATAQQLAEVIRRYQADYIEARLEESNNSHITYRGRELESIGRATAAGGNIRALVKGGWGFVSFDSFDELPGKVELAIKQAQFVGNEVSRLAAVEPVVDSVPAGIDQNPVTIPLAEKKGLLDEYNDIIWHTPKVQTSVIGYGDSFKKVILVNSLGSYVEQARADTSLRVNIVATEGGEVQQAGISTGSRGNFGEIQGLHSQVEATAQRAVALLSAPQAKGGAGPDSGRRLRP